MNDIPPKLMVNMTVEEYVGVMALYALLASPNLDRLVENPNLNTIMDASFKLAKRYVDHQVPDVGV